MCNYFYLSPYVPLYKCNVSLSFFFSDAKDESEANTTMTVIALEVQKENPGFDLHFYYLVTEDDGGFIQSFRQFAELPNRTPLLAIVDIPKQIKYVSEITEIDENTVRTMVNDYKGGLLSENPLQNS